MTATTIDASIIHFETQDCGRCSGSGKYSFNQIHGNRCYGCGGTGQRYSARGRSAMKAYEAALGASAGTVHLRDLKAGMRIKSEAHGGVSEGTVYDLKAAWRTIAEVTITEETLAGRGSDGKYCYDVEGVRAQITFDDGRTWSAVTSDDERYWHKSAGHEVGTTRGFWLGGEEARAARAAVRISIAKRFTGAWLEGQEEPTPAVRAPRTPKAAPAPKAAAPAPAPRPLPANMYPGQCRHCDTRVEANAGERLRVDGRCTEHDAPSAADIAVTAETNTHGFVSYDGEGRAWFPPTGRDYSTSEWAAQEDLHSDDTWPRVHANGTGENTRWTVTQKDGSITLDTSFVQDAFDEAHRNVEPDRRDRA